MGQSHLENAESTAFTANPAPQLQEGGLGSLSLQDIRNLDTKPSTAILPELDLNQALSDTKGPINSPELNKQAQQDVWAPEESLSLGPKDSTINSPADNWNAIQGHEHEVWAPEEELSLGPKPVDSTINSPGENRKAIEGHEKDVWAPEEELSLDGRHSKQRPERKPISTDDDGWRVWGGDKDRPHWMWAPEEKMPLNQHRMN